MAPHHANALIACDLSADLGDLLTLDADTLRERLYSKKETLLEQGILPVPLKLVHINKCPILAPLNTLRAEDAERLGISRAECLDNLKELQRPSEIRSKVQAIFRQTREFAPGDNVETELYNGFFSPADKNSMTALRSLPPEKLADSGLVFQDTRIGKLLFHYRARHFYPSLSRAEQIRWQKYRRKKLETALPDFSLSLQSLAEQYAGNPDKLMLLQDLYEYAEKLVG
ncbi:exodeoxyribonuclease I domain protein [Neisseria sp. oral taxon 020 str. F0370]|nr:exodeoxyribonuclease I domain protein [Neisseria sp. oral taxon 020 str. F0370]